MPTRPQTHKPARPPARDGRPSSHARGYGRWWRKVRVQVLHEQPVCAIEGCNEPATEVDHALALAKGGTHDRSNLVAYCKSHHSAKTVADDGGLGRKSKEQA